MSLSEFDIIATYFNKPGLTPTSEQQELIPLGIGDDCALLSVPEGKLLAMSMDVLVADVHFPVDAQASLIAQRALAVNLSDLAAMGASPLAFTLGLSLPSVDEHWLASFSEGLSNSAQQFNCPLVGGDMTKGALAISIQVHGLVEKGQVLCRSGASAGDKIYVTGDLGGAGLALHFIHNTANPFEINEQQKSNLKAAYYQPQPRIVEGLACVSLASSAIDISDGLLADLGHIAKSCSVGMVLELTQIPLSTTANEVAGRQEALKLALSAGDDYELALTIPKSKQTAFDKFVKTSSTAFTYIGRVVEGEGVSCVDDEGNTVDFSTTGYQHF